MASIINASSSGSGGIVQTADASGVLQLQSNGSIGLSISGTTVTGTTSVNNQFKNPNSSGSNYGWTAGSQGAIFAPNSSPGLAAQFIVDNSGRGISISTQDDNSTSLGTQLRMGTGASTGSTHGTINVNDNTTGLNGNLIISAKSVTMPLQPSFLAVSNSGDTTVTAGNPIPLNVAAYNVGSCYNTSTYRFTAPVAGKYLFTSEAYYTSSGGSTQSMQCAPFINGGQYIPSGAGDAVLFSAVTPNSVGGGVISIGGSVILNLAANDYVTMAARSNNGRFYLGHTSFSGQLIS